VAVPGTGVEKTSVAGIPEEGGLIARSPAWFLPSESPAHPYWSVLGQSGLNFAYGST
jgi:hypothetical protein